ncbi:MAG: alpha-galactosidase [Nakamurella sp.]
MPTDQPELLHLRADGVSVLLRLPPDRQAEILWWGTDLGPLSDAELSSVAAVSVGGVPNNSLDRPYRRGLLPERSQGYRGRPGLVGHRAGDAFAPLLRTAQLTADANTVVLTAVDERSGLQVDSTLELDAQGVLHLRHTLTNTGDTAFEVGELALIVPIPPDATEIADFTGRWTAERMPQRLPLREGAWLRQNRRGRTGSDAATLMTVGTESFRFRSGQVWAVHLGWSGDQSVWAESHPDGTRVLGAAELLEAGEIVLAPGERYTTPELFAVHSAAGSDGIADRLHTMLRARAHHPSAPRPVVLNTWEAVYFDHDLARLKHLADVAADLGVERFVLDDGWFGGRRNDLSSLGDWQVSTEAWPDGLGPIAQHVQALGMQFGLWFEPEMINEDSELYRAHPDWVLADPDRLPDTSRHQQVLDVARPEVSAYLFSCIDSLVKEYRIAFLKWDHNRDLVAARHDGRAGVHAQTAAVYALLDRLRDANPGLEIESCSSGGARVDLGILQRTDRVWASDCNDAVQRMQIQRGTSQLIPLELIGAHVGPPTAHTSHRTHDLSMRVAAALFGHFGIEWDIASATEADRAGLREAIALYRRLRPLLHTGSLVNVDHPDPAAMAVGVVSKDRRSAVFTYHQIAMGVREAPAPLVFPGLDPGLHYRVSRLEPAGAAATIGSQPPPWWTADETVLPATMLSLLGLPLPVLHPEQAVLLELTAL